MQNKGSKERFFKGIQSDKPRLDLMIADMPEGLPVPNLSAPPSTIPKWNEASPTWLQEVFEFADGHIHDDGALIVIHPWKGSIRNNILGYASSYSFLKKKDWWGMNRLHLASPVSLSSTV